MFRKNYIIIGHQRNSLRELIFWKWRVNKRELKTYLEYVKSYYNCYAIEYYIVKGKGWYK